MRDSRKQMLIKRPSQQPTEFWLEVFTFDEVFKTPSLTVSLAGYSEQQQGHASCGSRAPLDLDAAVKNNRALLFLRLQSAADFFSTNTTLMRDPPNVHVDISTRVSVTRFYHKLTRGFSSRSIRFQHSTAIARSNSILPHRPRVR